MELLRCTQDNISRPVPPHGFIVDTGFFCASTWCLPLSRQRRSACRFSSFLGTAAGKTASWCAYIVLQKGVLNLFFRIRRVTFKRESESRNRRGHTTRRHRRSLRTPCLWGRHIKYHLRPTDELESCVHCVGAATPDERNHTGRKYTASHAWLHLITCCGPNKTLGHGIGRNEHDSKGGKSHLILLL